MSDVDDFLAHYGVKGMQWGKTKKPVTPKQRLKELDKKLDKLPGGQRVFDGAMLRAHYSSKEMKRQTRKDPEFERRKMTPEVRNKLDKKIERKAYSDLAVRAVGEAAVAAVLGRVAGKHLFGLNESYSAKSGAAFAFAVVAARGNQIYNVSAASRANRIHNEISDINKTLAAQKKKK